MTENHHREDHARTLVMFSLGPVQSFIEAARSVRDLWMGSWLVSWLTWHAAQPVMGVRGATVYIPGRLGKHPPDDPCLPNTFSAVVPGDQAEDLPKRCRDACRSAWREIATKVRQELNNQINEDEQLPALATDWDRLWDSQCDSFLDMRVVTVPLEQASDATEKAAMELLGQLGAADKMIRHFPADTPVGHDGRAGAVPEKCTLLGTYEQMGPSEL